MRGFLPGRLVSSLSPPTVVEVDLFMVRWYIETEEEGVYCSAGLPRLCWTAANDLSRRGCQDISKHVRTYVRVRAYSQLK